jgi:hypothetical protein
MAAATAAGMVAAETGAEMAAAGMAAAEDVAAGVGAAEVVARGATARRAAAAAAQAEVEARMAMDAGRRRVPRAAVRGAQHPAPATAQKAPGGGLAGRGERGDGRVRGDLG